ncbi:MAG: hypothetical protein R3F11_15030 [Verrucomicrobiales bacterium]
MLPGAFERRLVELAGERELAPLDPGDFSCGLMLATGGSCGRKMLPESW